MSKHAPSILHGSDLRKTYQLGRVRVPVLKGASLDVGEGEWVAVLGASGSGKSTLLHLLGDLDRADSGESDVLFESRSLRSMSSRERNLYRNRSVGFVFQFYHLLPELSTLENTYLPALIRMSRLHYYRHRKDIRDRAGVLLDSFGLGHRLSHRPRELSGGERQRVAIARGADERPPRPPGR